MHLPTRLRNRDRLISKKPNGSVGRLAEAFGDVISEAMDSVRADMRNDVREEVQASEERLNARIDGTVEDIVAEREGTP